MSDVKRYVHGSTGMLIRDDGEWCRYENYDALKARLAEAERDTERLNWLDTQRGNMVHEGSYGDAELVGHDWGVQGQCYAVRDAIDAARATDSAPAQGLAGHE